MEKYITVTYCLTKEQYLKNAAVAKEKDISASKNIRKLIDKMPAPKNKK